MIVKIKNTSSALGDTIGSVCQVDRYQKITNNIVYLLINKNFIHLFEKAYPNILFKDTDIFDQYKEIHFHFDQPLQKGYSDDLGLDFEESNTKIFFDIKPRNIKQKYVTLSTHSTHQARYWNKENGWDLVVKYLKEKYNISSVSVDKFESFGNGKNLNYIPKKSINRCGLSLESCCNYLQHAEFHLGTSNGLTWLAHAMNKKVVLISNVTKKWCEFKTEVYRVDNEKVCHGCLNEEAFDANNWMWCPRNKNFECTKTITFEMVKEKIDQCINDLKIFS